MFTFPPSLDDDAAVEVPVDAGAEARDKEEDAVRGSTSPPVLATASSCSPRVEAAAVVTVAGGANAWTVLVVVVPAPAPLLVAIAVEAAARKVPGSGAETEG